MPLRRVPHNPLLRPVDIPAFRSDLVDVTSVFNPGAALWRGREVLLLRVQTRVAPPCWYPLNVRPTASSLMSARWSSPSSIRRPGTSTTRA